MTTHDDNAQEAQQMRHNSRMVELGLEALRRKSELGLSALEAAKAAIDATFGPRNSAVKRLVHQMFEYGPTHPLIRAQYQKFARKLEADPELDALGLEDALAVFYWQWVLNEREATNTDLFLTRRHAAAFRSARYRAIAIALRYLRRKGTTPAEFESIRLRLCSIEAVQ